MPQRDYIFYELTKSVCHHCRKLCDAKIIFRDNKVYMLKQCLKERCRTRKDNLVLVATDIEYYKSQKDYYKPGDMPEYFANETILWCPWDCWICTDHEQHACLSIVEITDQCNMRCPICFAESDAQWHHRSMEDINKMFDTVCRNEAEPDIVQISGWEPTIHPQFWEILDEAKKRPFRYLMVNTNGIRIAQDREFAKKLATYQPDFEVYLQFDSFEEEALRDIRGVDMRAIRQKALDHLNEFGISTTLVMVAKKWKNDHEYGKIIDFALTQPCVRGVTIQPIQAAWRTEHFDPAQHRLTLTDVRQGILDQTDVFASEDIIPLPCHPENIAMWYALKYEGKVMPLARYIPKDVLLQGTENTIIFEDNEKFKQHFFDLFSLWSVWEDNANCFGSLLCCLPQIQMSQMISDQMSYKNVFRVLIISFMDLYDLDIRSVKRSCIQFATPQWHMFPFDTYNLFYRDKLSRSVIKKRRQQHNNTE